MRAATRPRSGPGLVAELTLRALLRRRLTLAILVGLPIVFFFVTNDRVGRSVRALVFGATWAMSTAAFFAGSASHQVEPRLHLAGWARWRLFTGRLLALTVLGLVLTLVFVVVVAASHEVRSLAAVALDLAVSAAVAVALGTAVGSLIRREMEGTMILFLFAGLQAVVNPFDLVARFLPFWSSRELGTYAIDGPDQGSLGDGLAHALAVIILCGLVTAVALQAEKQRGPSFR